MRKENKENGKNGKEILSADIDVGQLPKKIREMLGLIKPDDQVIVHGSLAKAVLEWYLTTVLEPQSKAQKPQLRKLKTISLDAVLNRETSPDIAIFREGEINIDELDTKFNEIQKRFSGIKVSLKPVDVDVAQSAFDEAGIRNYLLKSDLTINEVLLVPVGQFWKLLYTRRCVEHTYSRVGILSGNSPGLYRFDCGRMVASNAGMARLLKFLVEGKVGSIYLPEWWINANTAEAKRLKQECMGGFALILLSKYSQDKGLQRRLMRILNNLRITDLVDYSMFLGEQKLLFQAREEKPFIYNDNRTFREIWEAKKEQKQNKEKSKEDRNRTKSACNHEIIDFTCNYCKIGKCEIKRCTKCTFARVTPQGFEAPVKEYMTLLCNRNWQNSAFFWDDEGFYFYPS